MSDSDLSSYILRYDLLNTQIQYFNGANFYPVAGAGVSSLNTLTGAITLAAGSNITLTPSGNTITIASTGGGGGSFTPTTQFTATTAFSTTSTNYDATGISMNFAMANASHKLKITVSGNMMYANASNDAYFTIYQDNSVDIASPNEMSIIEAPSNVVSTGVAQMSFSFLFAPGDTASHNYQVYIRVTGGAVPVYFPNNIAYMIIEEVI